MASQFITALDTVSGKVGQVPRSYLDHPVLGKNLEEVKPDSKDRNEDLHKPRAARKPAADKTEGDKLPTLDGADL